MVALQPEQLGDFFDAVPVGVYLCDPDGVIRAFNAKAAQIWGREPQIGDTGNLFCGSFALYHPDGYSLPKSLTPMARVLKEGVAVLGEEVIIERPDGSRVIALVNVAPLTDATGSLIGAVNCFQDISDKKRIELDRETLLVQEREARKALEAARSELSQTLESITDVFFSIDDGFRFTYVNRKAEELWGKRREEILGLTMEEAFPQVVGSYSYGQIQTALQERKAVVFEALSPVVGRWIECRVYPRESGASVYFHDITDRRLLETEREAERQRLKALVEASPVGVVVIDAASESVLLTNKEIERISGSLPSGSDAGHWAKHFSFFRTSSGQPYPLEDSPFARALYGGERVSAYEMQVESGDRLVPVLVSATPVYESDGRLTSVIGTIQDMTPVRTAERLRNEFQGMVTHELRSPLVVIKSSVFMAREDLSESPDEDLSPGAKGEILEVLNGIDSQADRLLTMIANLLDVTQMEAGAFAVTHEPISLRQALDDAVAARGRHGSSTIETYLPANLSLVMADRARVVQIFDNLLSNAEKFSFPNSPIVIDVESLATSALVRVRNKGVPVSPDKMPLLFKKFSRLSPGRVPRTSGTGLGLAICKGIVEAHAGRIWAESSVERQEMVFAFTLPFAQTMSSEGRHGNREEIASQQNGHRPTRVLVVDDEPLILRFVERLLREGGYAPIATVDPAEAEGLLYGERPDLALLDLRMPGIDGLELLRRFRAVSSLPIIFLSANDRAEDKAEALRRGADDYVTKPFDREELLARIEAALRRRARG